MALLNGVFLVLGAWKCAELILDFGGRLLKIG